jgi:histidine triad (HIT) family protein
MLDCTFCKIVSREMPSQIVYEDEEIVAFHDINPQAPVHVLIVPRKHIESVLDVTEEDRGVLGAMLVRAKDIARQLGVDEKGFRLVINTGKYAGQAIYHIHLHLIGGRRMTWPPG